MAFRVWKSNNYLYVLREEDNFLIDGAASRFEFVKSLDTDSAYRLLKDNQDQLNKDILISELKKENGDPYTAQEFETFKELNTGFNPAGPSAIPTQDIFNGGFVDYNDLATATTPINFTAVGETKLTNDKQGPFTNETYLPNGITSIWNTINNQFDWSELKLGDMVDLRLDVEVTTNSPNQTIRIDLYLGVGQIGEYSIPFVTDQTFKSSGAHKLNRFNGIYMGDLLTLNNPGEFRISSDDSGSVKVNGWYCKIIRKG